MSLPKRKSGRSSQAAEAAYQRELRDFCATVREIRSRLDFEVSSRGWAYIFENEGIITKQDLDACQELINDCRKSGALPLNICSVDEKRSFENIEVIDDNTAEEEADRVRRGVRSAHLNYFPVSFWDFQDTFIQMVVEKIDLKSVFRPVCEEFHVPTSNAAGWSDLNMRANMMERFRKWEYEGKQCVLLYCGDHDPAGLQISDYLRSNLRDLSNAVGWDPENLIIERFGLNADFIATHRLTWIENLITSSKKRLDDPRHSDHNKPYVRDYIAQHGVRKVEANALVTAPTAGRRLCRAAIIKHLDLDRVAEYHERIRQEQAIAELEIFRVLPPAA